MTFQTRTIRVLTLSFLMALGLAGMASSEDGQRRFNNRMARQPGSMDALRNGARTQQDRWGRQTRQLDSRTRRVVEGRSSRTPQLREMGNRARTDRNMRKLGKNLRSRTPNTRTATRAVRTGRVNATPRKVTFRLPDGTRTQPGKQATRAKTRPSRKVASGKPHTKVRRVAKAKIKAPKVKGSKISKSALGKGLAVGVAAAVIGVNIPDPISAATWVGDTFRDPSQTGKRFEKLGQDAVKEIGNGLKTITNPAKMAQNTVKLVEGVGNAAITVVTRPDKALESVGKGIVDVGKGIGGIFGIK